MNQQQARNIETVRSHYDRTWNQQDLDLIDQTHHADCVHHDPSNPASMCGTAQLKAHLEAVFDAFPDVHMHIDQISASGEDVFVRWTTEATHSGEFMGMPGTGRRVRFSGIIQHRLRDGRIEEDWSIRDTLSFLTQLGALPAPGAPPPK
ncbi:MAG: ester cyclase [Alphaproteobacteria bacterium]|nr:ester cyclase [Alphaproteobacteria bacterium]MCB9793671.1 ester cyclase [Alphaproteobacteria bacterium]